MSATADVDALGRFAVELATGAARLVAVADARRAAASRPRSEGLRVSVKSTDTDLVTEVDHACEQWLVEQILARRPDDAVLGEERGERTGTSGVRWVLDPIDGTVNFVLGLPQYAVSVGVEFDGRVVAGAVCNPASGELFSAVRGRGAVLRTADGGEQTLSGPRAVSLDRAVIGTGFGYDSRVRARQADVVVRLLPRVADIRRMGAASLDLCAVASGRLDGYFEAALNPWDVAAGGLIAEEAGCTFTGLRGGPASPRLTVAAGPGLAAHLTDALQELRADEVLEG